MTGQTNDWHGLKRLNKIIMRVTGQKWKIEKGKFETKFI